MCSCIYPVIFKIRNSCTDDIRSVCHLFFSHGTRILFSLLIYRCLSVRMEYILLTIQFLFRDTHGKTGYQDPEAFARCYEAQKENYVGLQSEHEISGKVYHVTNFLDRSKETTAFDKIDELIDRNR